MVSQLIITIVMIQTDATPIRNAIAKYRWLTIGSYIDMITQ